MNDNQRTGGVFTVSDCQFQGHKNETGRCGFNKYLIFVNKGISECALQIRGLDTS